MTRARKRLFLTYVVTDSQRQQLAPSRFLHEISQNLVSWQGGHMTPSNHPPAQETAFPGAYIDPTNAPPAQGMVSSSGATETGFEGQVDGNSRSRAAELGAGSVLGGIRYTVNGEGGEGGLLPGRANGAGAEQSAAGMRFLQR